MESKFILNLIHRPEMVPEYAEKVTGQGKEENLGRKTLLTESLDIFKTQQAIAHKNGLKTTIQMTYASLFNDEAVALAKHDHEVYGDEIGSTLLGSFLRGVPQKVPHQGFLHLDVRSGDQEADRRRCVRQIL